MRNLIILGVCFLVHISFRSESLDFKSILSKGEMVFIFNQPKYFPGDTAYFAASLKGFPSQITKGKRVVGLSLIDANNEVRHYSRTLFINGSGQGQLILPAELQSGGYWLVATVEGFILEEDNSVLSFKTRFIISGEFDYSPLIDQSIDSLEVNLQYNAVSFKSRQPIKVTFKSDAAKHADGITISVFKESLFLSENNVLDPSIHRLVAMTSSRDLRIGKQLNPYFFKGSVILGNTQRTVPDSTQIVFYLNNSDFIFQVFTDRSGKFSFPLFKDFPDEEIFYAVFIKGEQIDSVQLDLDIFEYKGERISAFPTKNLNAYTQYYKQLKLIEDSYLYFAPRAKKNILQDVEWWPDVDHEVNLERLEPFNTMIEVFQSVIPLVKYKKIEGGDGIRVFLKRIQEYATKDPVLIIDGIMTDNMNYFFDLDPRGVKRVGICRTPERLARYGRLGENGIVVVETVDEQLPETARTDRSLFITGIAKTLTFQKNAISADSRIPLFKSCLYWNPWLKPNDIGIYEFLFSTADHIGYFIIQITYIDEYGQIHLKNERILVTP